MDVDPWYKYSNIYDDFKLKKIFGLLVFIKIFQRSKS